jgi:hypothetical protein
MLLYMSGIPLGAVRSLPLVKTEYSVLTTIIKDGPATERDVCQSLIKPFRDGCLPCRLIRKRTGRKHAVGYCRLQVSLLQPFQPNLRGAVHI